MRTKLAVFFAITFLAVQCLGSPIPHAHMKRSCILEAQGHPDQSNELNKAFANLLHDTVNQGGLAKDLNRGLAEGHHQNGDTERMVIPGSRVAIKELNNKFADLLHDTLEKQSSWSKKGGLENAPGIFTAGSHDNNTRK